MQTKSECFMLNYFPRYFSVRAMICYAITLALVSSLFINYAMPFQFMVFGIVYVVVFFSYSNKLSQDWQKFKPSLFTKRLFVSALIIRVVYVVFIYFYYIEMTGQPHMFHAGDELFYLSLQSYWKKDGFEYLIKELGYLGLSDRGFVVWLNFISLLFGEHVLIARIIKCFMDAFSCVLMYNLAKRNFGEATGRMVAIFCMLIPTNWYYCGVTLKESEMAFMVVLFVERADLALRSKEITIGNLILPGVVALVMFAFRTALAAVMVAALVAGIILSSGKQLEMWKKIMYTVAFAIWMLLTVGVEIMQDTQNLWERRTENQSIGYEEKLRKNNANTFIQYASASTMAPLIFTIPISSMVQIEHQETQMMQNGAFFIKNILSGFTIFALFSMLFSGEWRKHVLPIAVTCGYLVVIVFSVFAHAERFHFPVLAMELMFAAYGVTLMKNKHKRWYTIWLVFICIGIIGWNWIKLRGRGFV